jgi:hypothetical protein
MAYIVDSFLILKGIPANLRKKIIKPKRPSDSFFSFGTPLSIRNNATHSQVTQSLKNV